MLNDRIAITLTAEQLDIVDDALAFFMAGNIDVDDWDAERHEEQRRLADKIDRARARIGGS